MRELNSGGDTMEDNVSKLLRESESVRANAAAVSADADRLIAQARQKVLEFDGLQAEKKQAAESFRALVNTKGLPPGTSVKCFSMAMTFIGGVAEAEGIATEGLRAAGIPEPGLKASSSSARKPRTSRLAV
jgi:hypothetical protein